MCVTMDVEIGMLKTLFHIEFGFEGSNDRAKEEQTWVYFGDFLDECDGNYYNK